MVTKLGPCRACWDEKIKQSNKKKYARCKIAKPKVNKSNKKNIYVHAALRESVHAGGDQTSTHTPSPRLLSNRNLYISMYYVFFLFQATLRSALETGTVDLEGRSLASLAPGLFQDTRALSAATRAKLSGNKLQVLPGVTGV